MPTTAELLWGFCIPPVVAFALCLVGNFSRGRNAAGLRSTAPTIALALGYAIAYLGLFGISRFPPTRQDDALFYGVAAVALLVVTTIWRRLGRYAQWVLGFLILAAMVYLMLRFLIGTDLGYSGAIASAAVLAALLLLWSQLLSFSARLLPDWLVLSVLAISAATVAVVLTQAGLTIRGGMIGAAVTLLFVSILLPALWTRRVEVKPALFLVVAILLPGRLVYAAFAMYPPPTIKTIFAFWLCAAAPLALLIAAMPTPRRGGGPFRWIALALELGLGALAALLAHTPPPADY